VAENHKIFKEDVNDIYMGNRLAINIIIEREKVDKEDVFIASSPDINVFAEGKTIEESKRKFLEGMESHLEAFPEVF